jgi:hypothetical protein
MNHETNPGVHESDGEEAMDRLMTRLIDGEATLAEYDAFDEAAEAAPSLWRELATRQLDMRMLVDAVETHTAEAIRTPLPNTNKPSIQIFPRKLSWPLTMSGWAAAVLALVAWAIIALANQQQQIPSQPDIVPAAATMTLSAEDHYEAYRAAPYVLGEMQPVVLDVEELSDGRIAVRFVRRIEEVAMLDPEADLPVDDDGELTSDLRALRDSEPRVTYPNDID